MNDSSSNRASLSWDGVQQRADLVEHRPDLLWDSRVRNADHSTVAEVWAVVGARQQVDELLPTAETLRTLASRSAGIFGDSASDSVASAPERVACTSVTLRSARRGR